MPDTTVDGGTPFEEALAVAVALAKLNANLAAQKSATLPSALDMAACRRAYMQQSSSRIPLSGTGAALVIARQCHHATQVNKSDVTRALSAYEVIATL